MLRNFELSEATVECKEKTEFLSRARCPLWMLPIDIIHFFHIYLLGDARDGDEFIVRVFNIDWQNFLSTSKKYLLEWKRKTQYLSLNSHYSNRFFANELFRYLVLASVENPRKQICVHLKDPYSSDFSPLNDIHSVVLSGRTDILLSYPVEVEELVVLNLPIPDLSFGSKVSKLHVYSSSVANLNVHGLFFENLTELSLPNCPSVTNVSVFRHLRALNLMGCYNLTDVSNLGKIYDLNLSRCMGVSDVSKLGRVHKLNLAGCTKITDISALHSVYQLDLTGFTGTTVAELIGVKILNLSYCKALESLLGLQEVEDLNITGCDLLADISNLRKIKKLDISYCPNILGLSELTTLRSLSLGRNTSQPETVEEELPVSTAAAEELPAEEHKEGEETEQQEEFEQELPLDNSSAMITAVGEAAISQAVNQAITRTLSKIRTRRTFTSLTQLKSISVIGSENTTLVRALLEDCSALKSMEIKYSSLLLNHTIGNPYNPFNLNKLTNLVLNADISLEELETLPALRSLTLIRCSRIKQIHSQPALRELTIIDCSLLEAIDFYADTSTSHLNNHLHSDSQDEKNDGSNNDHSNGVCLYKGTIVGCPLLDELFFFSKMFEIKLVNNKKLKSVYNAQFVTYLTVRDCHPDFVTN
jgi:hypothetical protein